MKVLCLLLVSGLALTYALPPTYRAGPVQMFDDDDDVDDDAEVEDDADDDNNDMYTFGTGGPGGPPSNVYLEGPQSRSGRDAIVSQLSNVFYATEKDIPEGVFFTYDNDKADAAPALLPQGRKEKVVDDNEDDKKDDDKENNDVDEDEDAEDEEDEEDDDAEQDDDTDGFSVPDMNKLFPNPDNRPVGPGSYQQYLQHLPNKKEQQQQQQQPGRGYILPPQNRYASSGYQGRVPVPLTHPARRFRSDAPLLTKYGGLIKLQDDSVIVDAAPTMYRMAEDEPEKTNQVDEDADAEDDAEDSQEDEEEADDDVDFSVPSWESLFPNSGNKATPNFYGSMKNSWNNAPKPPSQQNRGRLIPLFHNPLHDQYNPEYVIDPTEALNRRNERLRNRYPSNPRWQMKNIKHPWNYKPLLYQQGHYGNPREYHINPKTGHMYYQPSFFNKHPSY